MCVSFPSRDLNSGPYPPHHTSTYICEVTIVSRMCSQDKENVI